MMEIVEEDELRLIELFRQKAADKRHELQMRTVEQLDEQRKLHHERKLRKEEEERKLEETMATTAQLAAFRDHLDDYDTATVHALMDNRHALDLITKQREEMDASAYRLSDGRTVFKTEDGHHVFDQHGTVVAPETIHPDAIPDNAPTWDAWREINASERKLLKERDELHAYQKRLDETREVAGRGNIAADALAKMDADLKQTMPDAVKAQLPESTAARGVSNQPLAPLELPRLSAAQFAAPVPAGP